MTLRALCLLSIAALSAGCWDDAFESKPLGSPDTAELIDASLDADADSDSDSDSASDADTETEPPWDTDYDAFGGNDAFLARFEADGSLEWAVRADGGEFGSTGVDVVALPDDTIGVVGIFGETLVLDPGQQGETVLEAEDERDLFLARFDAGGGLLRARRDGSGKVVPWRAAATDEGGLLVCGWFEGDAALGNGDENATELSAAGGRDALLARYDADDRLLWAVRAGGSTHDVATSVAPLAGGGSYLAGGFGDEATFGPGTPNETTIQAAGQADAFLARYDADGAPVWIARVECSEERCAARDVARGADGGAIVAGRFSGTALLDPGGPQETSLECPAASGIFLASWSEAGSLLWARAITGQSGDAACFDCDLDLAVRADGSILLAGVLVGAACFGEGPNSELEAEDPWSWGGDIFLASYGASGSLQWVVRAGGTAREAAHAVVAHQDGSAAVTGCFSGWSTFGPGETGETNLSTGGTTGDNDIFAARWSAGGELAWAVSAGGFEHAERGLGAAALESGSTAVTGFFGYPAVFGAGEENQTILEP
ncbi:MAG: hypothetical protein R6V85_15410 [Polyangia bacterium]